MPKISVIVPAYNSERFLPETLDCLLSQSLKDIEVVIVNDGSTDGTQEIIDSYREKSPIFKCFSQENAGVSAARNFGLEKATGKYVVFLDADDIFSEGSLEAFWARAEETGADIVLGTLRVFNEEGMGKHNIYAEKLSKMDEIPTFTTDLLWNFLIGNKCYNRERLVASGVRFPGFKYSEEGAFFMSYVYTGARIVGTTGSCMCYRRHSDEQGHSVSQTVNKELCESMIGSLSLIYDKACEAVKAAPDGVDREGYLQEVIYKTAYILINQFYRLVWQGDDACFSYAAGELTRLKSMMTPERFQQLCNSERDLHLERICMSGKELCLHPDVSVIINPRRRCNMDGLFNSLYCQLSPLFKVIVPQRMLEEDMVPEAYRDKANLVVLPDKGFVKAAKTEARTKRKIVLRSCRKLDIRDFRMVWRLNIIPERVKDLFFPVLIRGINFLLVSKIVK